VVSRCVSAAGVRFSVILCPPRNWALLTVGLPAKGRTPTGFPRSARTSNDRGGCPLYSGDNGAHPDRSRSPASIRRILNGTSLHPATTTIDAGLRLTKHQQGFKQFTRPIFPSPDAPGWNTSALGFPPSSAPRDYSQRTPGRGQVIEHGPETTLYVIDLASNPASFTQCVRPRVARDKPEACRPRMDW